MKRDRKRKKNSEIYKNKSKAQTKFGCTVIQWIQKIADTVKICCVCFPLLVWYEYKKFRNGIREI